MTKPQLRALRHLASVNWCTPARLGEAMSDRKNLASQGAGRIGGAMGTRLVKKGLASYHYATWPVTGNRYSAGYEINQAGRAAIKEEI